MAFPPAPQIPPRGARSLFSDAVDAFVRWLAALPAQLDAFLARLESVAAGGAYAFSFTYSAPANIGHGAGLLATLNSLGAQASPQTGAVFMYADLVALGGQNIAATFASFGDSSSGVKGAIRLVKTRDPSKYLIFEVTTVEQNSSLTTFTVRCTGSSSADPFSYGDDIMFYFTPAGDKGDVGNADKMVQTAPAPTNNVVTVDYRNGNCLVWSPAAGSTATLNIINWPPAGTLGEFWIIGSGLGAATVAMGAPVNWLRPDGTYASAASINTNHGATLRPTGEDNVLLWGRAGLPDRGKVAR